jgi:CAAX prenyl protease-like protein
MALLGATHALELSPLYAYPIRTVVVTAVLLVCSRGLVRLRPSSALASVLVGLGVFAVWVGPDLLWPGYRAHWLFTNPLTGGADHPHPANPVGSLLYILFRAGGSMLLIPIVEELFWRAWLMRWLVNPHFQKVPVGTYVPTAFWFTAVLFASEHGVYWDVGLAAGIVYNWWMVRTRSLADCILAHAVTNGALAGYVLLAGKWEYWL